MHLLGKNKIIRNNSKKANKNKINDWNFRWQYFYTFENMLKFKTLKLLWTTFDNTKNNLDNHLTPQKNF